MSKRFKVVTLGCRTNQYESQAYIDQLQQLGYTQAQDGESADLCIVNTCTVTESADASSRQTVRQLSRQNPGAQILVTGCASEKDAGGFEGIPGVLRVIPNKEKEELLPKVFPDVSWPEFSIKQFEAHTRAFVKVQDGCNSFCTYCIIPYVRGRSRSRKVEEILQEVRELIRNGFKEVVLTGINIGDFDGGVEPPVRLAELVRAVDAIEGLERLRISSIDPDEIDDDLLDAVLEGKHTCPSLHIVLQSGSNVILKRMNRKYTAQMFLDAIEKVKRACPEFTFTTDVIVGFPGESDADFADTLDMIARVRFAKVHMFPYSKREKTRAALYPNQVPAQTIQDRKHKVLQLAEQTAFALRQEYVGKVESVLLEAKKSGSSYFSGHTRHFLPVLVEGEDLEPNQIVRVHLRDNTQEALIGEVL